MFNFLKRLRGAVAPVSAPLSQTIPESWKPTTAPSFEDFNGDAEMYSTPKADPTPKPAVHLTMDDNQAAAIIEALGSRTLRPSRDAMVNAKPIFVTGPVTGEDLLKLMR